MENNDIYFIINILLSVFAGFIIGVEREAKGKPAGIGTHCFVIGGSMIFTYLSSIVDPTSTSRIAAQLVTGIGFLGAGVILKGELLDSKKESALTETHQKIVNLTTAASIWFSGAIGMAIGFNFYFVALISIAFAALVPRIPSLSKKKKRK